MSSEKRYLLGFGEMDLQHDYLYSLFDQVEEITGSSDRQSSGKLIDEIDRYLGYHFTCEEYLMRIYKYSGFAAHQSDHEMAASKLVQFMDDFDNDRLNPAAMRIFLTGWLMEHSKTADSGYVKWIEDCRRELFAGAALKME